MCEGVGVKRIGWPELEFVSSGLSNGDLWQVLLWLAFTAPASSHAALVKAAPADGAVLREAPAALTLVFNEPISPLVIRVIGPDGQPVALPDARVENATISIPVPRLQRGTHVLSWRVVSANAVWFTTPSGVRA